jgi:hypothetical protein
MTHPALNFGGHRFSTCVPARIVIAKKFFRYGNSYNPPCPPLKKGGNCKELQLKSSFEKGGYRGILRTSTWEEFMQRYKYEIMPGLTLDFEL